LNVRVWSVAEQELASAVLWYEEQCHGLGSEFLDQYEAAMAAIEIDAAGFPALETLHLERCVRRCRLKRFPYVIVFEILQTEVVVYALVHLTRDVGDLSRRIEGES
jgi:hypothetical protein